MEICGMYFPENDRTALNTFSEPSNWGQYVSYKFHLVLSQSENVGGRNFQFYNWKTTALTVANGKLRWIDLLNKIEYQLG